ncbi:MAG: LysM peptidoglycan-binding domain-containing protein [Anaerolineales bacterium]|nr:LysM peptidoglycan-binding domain-containing protein [Anaerolineales bacterium]
MPFRDVSRLVAVGVLAAFLAACSTPPAPAPPAEQQPTASATPTEEGTPVPTSTPLPTRPAYQPGELVDYVAQNGDTLIALAARFNTSIEEIRSANPIIPDNATTLPAGMPMQIPIYYRAYWGTSFPIVPDSQFVNGPAAVEFDTQAFVDAQPGWLRYYREYASGSIRSGAGLVDLVATNFSVSPRLLLALLEYQSGALSEPVADPERATFAMGHPVTRHRGVYLQLVWAANLLNDGYYQWRNGKLIEFERPDGQIYRPDPWQNAASVALQIFFNQTKTLDDFHTAIGPEGLAQTFVALFGDPWENNEPHMPGSLTQPELRLPFPPGQLWSFTGGPHTAWGQGQPYAALDFAPGSEQRGCTPSRLWTTAMAAGVVVRTDIGIVVLDLDGDNDERTGWVLFYLHLEDSGKAAVGSVVGAGQPLGHPSCEGGSSTGTHVHIARKYNGEWLDAAGALPFVMEGWTPVEGRAAYEGTLTRQGHIIRACTCSDAASSLYSQAPAVALPTPVPEDTPEG